MIKTVIFDMGGVIITLNHDEAVRRFSALGLQKADEVFEPLLPGWYLRRPGGG